MNATIKIDHVAVMVNDLEKSLHFYRDLLGLEVVSPEEHNDGSHLRNGCDPQGTHA